MRFVAGILVGFLIVAIAFGVLAATGAYNVAASLPPSKAETRLALYTVTKSVQKRASSKTNPFSGPEAVHTGLAHYKENCVMCHGAPGVPETEFGMGLNPPAPDLTLNLVQGMTDGQLFWVISNGIRMSGMPAFKPTHSEEQIWKTVAFVRHLPQITSEEQQTLKAGLEEEAAHHEGEAGEARRESASGSAAKPAAAPTPHVHPPGTKAHAH